MFSIHPSEMKVPNTWIVLAAYNEAPRISEVLHKLGSLDCRLLVVDDGSTDDTRKRAESLVDVCLSHPYNLGQGAALATGLSYCLRQDAEVIVTFDADGQHNPDDLNKLLEPIYSGEYEVALGSRFLGSAPGIPFTRALLLRLAVIWTRVWTGLQVTDTHNGLRAFSRQAARQLHIRENRMAHASEILDQVSRLKLKWIEIPTSVTYTKETLRKGQTTANALRILAQSMLHRFLR